MAFCKNCGKELSDRQDVCLSCGKSVNRQSTSPDTGGFGWGLLGFCVPIVGLILYLIWKDEKPLTAKSAGKGALISVIVSVAFYIVYFIIFALAFGSY